MDKLKSLKKGIRSKTMIPRMRQELESILQRNFEIDEEFELDDLYRFGYQNLDKHKFYEVLQSLVDKGIIEHIDLRGRYKRIR